MAPAGGPTLASSGALVAAAAQGDAKAFRALYEQTAPALERYVTRRGFGGPDAEDLLAETYRRAWESLPDYEDRGLPFVRWLYRILGNLIASQARRRTLPVAPLTDASSVSSGFEGAVVSALGQDRLWSAVAALPKRQQEVLVLRFVEDQSVVDCATMMQIREDAVRALTYRALRSLREQRKQIQVG